MIPSMKLKSIYLFMIAFLLTGILYANGGESKDPQVISLKGVVVDKDSKEALVGVKVIIEELDLELYTNLQGQFELKDVTPGQYNFQVSYISYKDETITQNVDLSNKSTIKIEIDPEL